MPRHLIDVHVLLVRDGQVLLSRRRDPSAVYDGRWHLPSGKLDAGESVLAGAVREAREEIGVVIAPADLRFVHTLHVRDCGDEPRLGVFFEVLRWMGEPVNREPDKCSGLSWFPLDGLPEDMIEYPAAGVRGYLTGQTFSVLGWSGAQ
jgi:8-oxo-dGTP diphosphatase